jgi:hypothetical protein
LHPPTVLALGFANPALTWGLAAASVPIILHLLNRRKFREVPWAAMKFLLAAVRKNSRRVRIEQWILLAVRTLVIVAVVTAMAKPFLEGLGAVPVIAGQRTHRVLVLDGSLSMGYADDDGTRFDRAKALAARLVRDARRGDAISLIVMGDPPRVVIGDPSPNHGEVLKEIDEVVMPHGGTDLVASFNKIDEVLGATSFQKEVVFLTDLQAASWRRPSGAGDEGLKRVLARVEARKPRSVVIDLGRSGGENRAVTDLRLNAPVVTAGTPVLVRAVVRNFGPSRKDGVGVRLVVDGALGPSQAVDLPVGEDQPVVFNHTFSAPGDHLLEVQIDADPLKLDDRRRLAVPVREELNVLLVDGDFKSEPFQAETDYLAQALSPGSGPSGAASVIKTDVVAEGQLARRELSDYDAVALCNIAQFTEEEVNALEDYLKQGGGVILFGGDQVVPENYNRLLYADGKGLLPAQVGPSVGDASKKESAFEFNALGFRHPVVEEFADAPDAVVSGLTKVKTWQYHKLKLPEGSPAKVALAFDKSGDPAVVEAPRHRGTVILVATSADSGWTTWPLHQSFPPVMAQVVLQAAAGRMSERNVRVGQPLEQALPAAGAAAPVTVVVPGGRTVASKLQPAGGVSLFHFEETELTGPYQVKVGPPLPLETSFAANPDPAESDPAKLDRAGLAAAVPGWTFAYMTNWKELTGNAAAVSRRGELHRPLLYALLALLLVESLLAWRFGHHA